MQFKIRVREALEKFSNLPEKRGTLFTLGKVFAEKDGHIVILRDPFAIFREFIFFIFSICCSR